MITKGPSPMRPALHRLLAATAAAPIGMAVAAPATPAHAAGPGLGPHARPCRCRT